MIKKCNYKDTSRKPPHRVKKDPLMHRRVKVMVLGMDDLLLSFLAPVNPIFILKLKWTTFNIYLPLLMASH